LTTADANPAGIDAGMRMRAFRKLDFDRRCRRAPGVTPDRRDHNLRETLAGTELSAPAINLASANLRATRDFPDYGAWRQALGNNRLFLLAAQTSTPFRAGDDLNPCHSTVSNTSANTVACTGAYQPQPKPVCKTATTGRLRLIDIG
jgi:hypothetical protein